jgi:excisionase family DNA binding protein
MIVRNESKSDVSETLLVDSREAARMLGVSPRTLWTLTSEGRIRPVRIGRLVRYSHDTLRQFCADAEAANENGGAP